MEAAFVCRRWSDRRQDGGEGGSDPPVWRSDPPKPRQWPALFRGSLPPSPHPSSVRSCLPNPRAAPPRCPRFLLAKGHHHAAHRTATQARSRSRQRPAGRTHLLLAEGQCGIHVLGCDGELDGYRTVRLIRRGDSERRAIVVATDRSPWRGSGSVPLEDDRRSRRLGAEGHMITSINGPWKLPELWKPAGTAGLGSHKFFARRATLRRLAQASTGHHQRLLDPDDSEDSRWQDRARRCDNGSARRHTPAPTTVNRVAAHLLPVHLTSKLTRILAGTFSASMPTTAAVVHVAKNAPEARSPRSGRAPETELGDLKGKDLGVWLGGRDLNPDILVEPPHVSRPRARDVCQ